MSKVHKETTRDEVIAQARASADKLGCDPDLLELMAIRIWEAAIETAVTQLSRQLHEYKQRDFSQQIKEINASRWPADIKRSYREVIENVIDIPSIHLNKAIAAIEHMK